MLQSLLVYSSLFAVMMLFSMVTQQRHSYSKIVSAEEENKSFWKIYIILPLILFAIVFGMRYDVGVDHLAYLSAYIEKISVSKGEPLFDAITNLFLALDLHYVYYFSFLAFIQVFLFFYAFKKEKYLFPFLVFFLFTNYEWVFWMNGIRQALALCVWLVAVRFIAEKRFWMYLLFCIASSMFHYSAAILIILYPLLKNGKDYFKSINFQLLLLLAVFVIQHYFLILLPKAEGILEFYRTLLGGGKAYGKSYNLEGIKASYIESKGTNLVYYFKIIVNFTIVLYSRKLKGFYDNNKFTVAYALFFIGLLTAYIFPIGFISITRPFRYLYIFETIMYAYFAYYLIKNKSSQNQITYFILILLFISVFFAAIFVGSEDSSFLYQFYFDRR